VYALLASGLTLIFGVMRVINIAHGALLILAAFLTYSLWTATGIDPLAAILITTPAMLVFGWLLYQASVGRIRTAPVGASVLLTFGLALVIEGVMGLIWGNTSHSVRPSYFNESFEIGEVFLPKAQVYGGALAIVVLGGLYGTLNHTWLGRAIRASAVNPQGAELVGVKVGSVAAMTFAIGVASVGAGGSIVSVLYPFLPGSHYQWIARLLGIIVLGGMGSLPGAAIGALALGVAETMTVTYISPAWATAVPYVFVIVVLLVRPQGLLGSRLREDVATA
jgi:branched-chain amino acid transport system permease protein